MRCQRSPYEQMFAYARSKGLGTADGGFVRLYRLRDSQAHPSCSRRAPAQRTPRQGIES